MRICESVSRRGVCFGGFFGRKWGVDVFEELLSDLTRVSDS
jgi:hypothetical protein